MSKGREVLDVTFHLKGRVAGFWGAIYPGLMLLAARCRKNRGENEGPSDHCTVSKYQKQTDRQDTNLTILIPWRSSALMLDLGD